MCYNSGMKKQLMSHKGFTLIELVVVIAILAILASVATVSIIAAYNSAVRKQDITQVETYYRSCNAIMIDINSGFSTFDKSNAGITACIQQRVRAENGLALKECKNLICGTPVPDISSADFGDGFYVYYRYCSDAAGLSHDTAHGSNDPLPKVYFLESVLLKHKDAIYAYSRTSGEVRITEL